jgi:hypothetical protein
MVLVICEDKSSYIAQFRVPIDTNSLALARYMNVNYVIVTNERGVFRFGVSYIYSVNIANILMWLCEV